MARVRVNDLVTIAGQPSEEELSKLWKEGFRAVVNFREDGEEPEQLSPQDERELTCAQGMRYLHLPTTLATISPELVDRFRAASRDLAWPIFAHCKSGKRAAAVMLAYLGSEKRMTEREIDDEAKRIGLDEKPDLVRFVRNYVSRTTLNTS